MTETLEDKAVLAALRDLQKALNAQNVAMVENLRYVQRIDDRVERTNKRIDELADRLDRRMTDLDRRISETNQRITELKDDFSTILRTELGGAFGNFQLKIENRLGAIEDRLEAMETKA